MTIAMKHDGMAAAVPAETRTVLVTGFGPFPGAPANPTLGMLDDLSAAGVETARLHCACLPVTFSGIRVALAEAVAYCNPDAVLLLGLATQRHELNVETMAHNRAGRALPDTEGVVPTQEALVLGGPPTLNATWPAVSVLAALHEAGQAATLSYDAGDYVCNAALFHALHDGLAPMIGFLHVPPIGVGGTTAESLAQAARCALRVLVAASPRREVA